MALGGAALAFHKEIPALSKFEVKMNVEAWDDKWCCESRSEPCLRAPRR